MQSIIMIKLHYYTVYYIIIMEIDVICSVVSSFCALGEELTAGGHQYLQQGDVFHSSPFGWYGHFLMNTKTLCVSSKTLDIRYS